MITWLQNIFGFQPSFGGVARSSQWPAVRKAYLASNPLCAVCGCKGTLLKPQNVHHVQPYHLHPELELMPSNFITVCPPHHLLVGHLMNWASYNVDVRQDAQTWLNKVTNRPVDNRLDPSKEGVE